MKQKQTRPPISLEQGRPTLTNLEKHGRINDLREARRDQARRRRNGFTQKYWNGLAPRLQRALCVGIHRLGEGL